MTFDEVLAQVHTLLQQEKRVSYRALKLRFSINDDYLEGLKDELIHAKRVAVDEDGKVLVWAGSTESKVQSLESDKAQSSRFKVENSPESKVQGPRSQNTDPRPLTPDPQGEAEAYFLKAIDIARKQQAKSLELRAVMSLSRLWQQQGKQKEAHRMLADIYNWFTAGFDTRDLQEAKERLAELSD